MHNGGWTGTAAEAFFAEMDETVHPAVGNLADALARSGQVTQEIIHTFQAAEEEAANRFRAGESEGIGGDGVPLQTAEQIAAERGGVYIPAVGQVEVAEKLGIAQSRVSDLVWGKWEKFSLEMLITLEARAGRQVTLELPA